MAKVITSETTGTPGERILRVQTSSDEQVGLIDAINNYGAQRHIKINGHVSLEALDVLENLWRKSTKNWGNQSNPLTALKCVSDTHEESREKLADCLHPAEEGGEPNFIFVNELGADDVHRTVAVTGNGPLSGDNADFIVNALVFMPDLIRTCRAALEHTCSCQ